MSVLRTSFIVCYVVHAVTLLGYTVFCSPAVSQCYIDATDFCVHAAHRQLVTSHTPLFRLAPDTDIDMLCSSFNDYEECRSRPTDCQVAGNPEMASHRLAYKYICSVQGKEGYVRYSAAYDNYLLLRQVNQCNFDYERVYAATEARRTELYSREAIIKLNTSLCSTTERFLLCVRDSVTSYIEADAGRWQYTIQQYFVDSHYHSVCGDLIDSVYVRKAYSDSVNLSGDERPRVIGAGILGIALLTATALLLVRYNDKIRLLYTKCRRQTQNDRRNRYRQGNSEDNEDTDIDEDTNRSTSVYTISSHLGSTEPVFVFRTDLYNSNSDGLSSDASLDPEPGVSTS